MKHAFNAPSIGLTGHFKMTVGGGKRGRVVLAEFDNLILDAGLNRLGTGAIATHIQVGTGSSTPTVSQTALDAFVAQTSTVLAYGAGNGAEGLIGPVALVLGTFGDPLGQKLLLLLGEGFVGRGGGHELGAGGLDALNNEGFGGIAGKDGDAGAAGLRGFVS